MTEHSRKLRALVVSLLSTASLVTAGSIARSSAAVSGSPAAAVPGLSVSGGVATYSADATIGRLSVPATWTTIVIGQGVTLRGNFLIPASRTAPLTIEGQDAMTSRLVGDGPHIKDDTYAAVSTDAHIDLTLRTFTSLDPRFYHVIAKNAKVLASGIRVIDDRDQFQNNSDGFGGGDGSVVENSYFDTWDDTFKLYYGSLTVRNTTVLQNANGAPVQMAWGDYGHGTLTIDGLTVVNHSSGVYNQGVFSWAGGVSPDSRTIRIVGAGLTRSTPPGMRTAPLYRFKNGVRNKTIVVAGGVCSTVRSTAGNTEDDTGAVNDTVRVTGCS